MPSDLPETMTAIAIREPGGPEVLVAVERRVPHAYEGEILVKVAAGGVNRPDVLQRQGLYPPPKGAPDIPGLEIAGTVAAVGRNVERWTPGDAVTALVPDAEGLVPLVLLKHGFLPLPSGLSMVEAAALPETVFTVWHNVFERGRLQAGERFLVHGGTSGIGTTAIQLAKAFGAEVFTTAGSAGKCAAAKELGADHAFDYNEEDFVDAIRTATDGAGIDVILDMVGGDYIERNYKAAAEDGRIVQIAFLNGPIAEVDFRRLMLKRLTHTGSTLRARPIAVKAGIARALENKVWPLIEAGRMRPVIDSVYPFEKAAEAHARMETSGHIGKIVLKVEG
ncbi:MAG: NAD(P)H-quinone oxidoreductase [Hyphomicrobiales bacterium]|nr:NAD(P)H-quinone oxidoreductase [Hyphomicrobiales bacterium]